MLSSGSARFILTTVIAIALLLTGCGRVEYFPSSHAVLIVCPNVNPGDINLNHIPFEIADCWMFSNYFAIGYSAFGNHPQASQDATDVNEDCNPLTVADLVLSIRIALDDARPYPGRDTMLTGYSHQNGLLTVSEVMGACFVVFDEVIVPELYVEMDMQYGYVNGTTHVVVYSTKPNRSFVGEFLRADANLLSIEFATFAGQPVKAQTPQP